MEPLSTRIVDERKHLFVGRKYECHWLEDWCHSSTPPTQIIAITGIAGIGKSTLLTHLSQLAQTCGTMVAWMDGRTCYRTPRGFLESLPAPFLEWKQRSAPRPKLILTLDNYEELHSLEAWLREIFLADLPATGLLLLTASRMPLINQWSLDPGWNSRIHHWPLSPFNPEEVDSFLAKRNWPDEDIALAHQLSLGHPLSLAIVAESRRRASIFDDPQQLPREIRETLSARLFKEVADPELHPLIETLSVMARANHDQLQRVMDKPIPTQQFLHLKQLSFVKHKSGEIGLHDIAVQYLYDEFRERDPRTFDRLRQRAVAVLLDEWDRVPQGGRGSLAQQLLWLCRDVFQETTRFADLSLPLSGLTVTAYWHEDYPLCRQFISEWRRQSLPLPHDRMMNLFDDVVANFPESIRVTRTSEGTPIGVFVAVPLHHATLSLLESYHPQLVRELLSLDLGITYCRIDETTATYNILAGVDFHQNQYAPQSILGVIARDQLSFQAGILGLLLLTNPELKQFLLALGYQAHPFPISEDRTVQEELFVLDLRQQHFGQWIRQILSSRSNIYTENPITAADLKYFLSHWSEPTLLNQSSLITTFNQSASTLKSQIYHLLESPQDALSSRDRELLRLTFLVRHYSSTQVAEALHVSRATYYRYLDQALDHLANILEISRSEH